MSTLLCLMTLLVGLDFHAVAVGGGKVTHTLHRLSLHSEYHQQDVQLCVMLCLAVTYTVIDKTAHALDALSFLPFPNLLPWRMRCITLASVHVKCVQLLSIREPSL